jgi:hypothetical protein
MMMTSYFVLISLSGTIHLYTHLAKPDTTSPSRLRLTTGFRHT